MANRLITQLITPEILNNTDFTGSGGRKDDSGKPARFDLIPPEALWALAELYGKGALKYAPRNWEAGINYGRVYAALMRHLEAWRMGEAYDPDNGQHHLISVIWNAVALYTYEQRGLGEKLDNLRSKETNCLKD